MSERIPPLRNLGIHEAELEERRKELRDLSRELTILEGKITALESGRQAAQQQDADDAARALRSGKKKPAAKREEALDAELKEATRDAAVYRSAISQVEAEIGAYIAENATRLIEELSEREQQLNRSQLEAVAAIEEARARRLALWQVGRWVGKHAPPEPTREQAPAGDHFEVFNLNTANQLRPTDEQITRVLLWLRLEAGEAEAHEQLRQATPSDAAVVIDGRVAEAHSFTRMLEARKAQAEGNVS